MFVQFRMDLARALRDAGTEVSVIGAPGDAYPAIEAEHFRFYPWSLKRLGKNPFAEANAVRELIALYRRLRPTIAHHVAMKPILYGSIAARATDTAAVNAVTGLGHAFIEGGSGRRALRAGIEQGYRFCLSGKRSITTFQNRDDLELFVSRKLVSRNSVRLIRGSGVDVVKFCPSPEPNTPVRVLLPARMLWEKGIGEFVEAAKILRARKVPCKFILAGKPDEGNLAAISVEQLNAWGLEGALRWIGHQSDMPALIASAHIVCLPSYREGVPLSLLEAAACGRAIVTTDVPGCREVVVHGENGLLVPARDSETLARAIEQLVLDKETRIEMGKRGRKRIVQYFSKEEVIEGTFAVYNSLLGSSSGVAARSNRTDVQG